jgi:hypothetical protein
MAKAWNQTRVSEILGIEYPIGSFRERRIPLFVRILEGCWPDKPREITIPEVPHRLQSGDALHGENLMRFLRACTGHDVDARTHLDNAVLLMP